MGERNRARKREREIQIWVKFTKTPPPRQIYVLFTVYSEQYQLDEVRWGERERKRKL